MKKLKQILIGTFFTLLIISCSNSSSDSSVQSTLKAKWAFGEQLQCGRNSIEFKDTNLFIEHHYNSNCTSIPYYGDYILSGSLLTINGIENVIVELTNTTLKLHQINNNTTKTYDKVN